MPVEVAIHFCFIVPYVLGFLPAITITHASSHLASTWYFFLFQTDPILKRLSILSLLGMMIQLLICNIFMFHLPWHFYHSWEVHRATFVVFDHFGRMINISTSLSCTFFSQIVFQHPLETSTYFCCLSETLCVFLYFCISVVTLRFSWFSHLVFLVQGCIHSSFSKSLNKFKCYSFSIVCCWYLGVAMIFQILW